MGDPDEAASPISLSLIAKGDDMDVTLPVAALITPYSEVATSKLPNSMAAPLTGHTEHDNNGAGNDEICPPIAGKRPGP